MIKSITIDDQLEDFGSTNYEVGENGVESIEFIGQDEWNNPYKRDIFHVSRTGKLFTSVDIPFEKVLVIFTDDK